MMDLEQILAIMAASMLPVHELVSEDGGRTNYLSGPSAKEIKAAVETSRAVWLEVLRQKRETQ